MTLLADIQAAQVCWQFPLTRKRILIRTPISLVSQLNPQLKDLHLFDPNNYDVDDTDAYVHLVLMPGYSPSNNFQAERGFQTQFSNRAAVYSTRERTFEATVAQPQAFLYYIVNRLVAISETSALATHAPIKIIDTCLPEGAGLASSVTIQGGDLGTIRYGRIDITKEPAAGLISFEGSDYCVGSWSFKFTELALRV